jgi:glucose-6-phosphate 1-epimerase
MKTTNLDSKEFMITQALHTYFSVSNIQNIKIKGLENKFYFDTLLDDKHKESKSIEINAEIDRVYIDTEDEVYLVDGSRTIKLQTVGSASTIVWNPWIEKCSKMSYMSKNAYKEFVCIESANAFDDFVMIKSKKSHTLELTISF